MEQKNKNISLYKIYKFKLKQFDDNGVLTINEKKLRKQKTLVRESELIRMINHLCPKDENDKISRFTLVPEIIALTVSEAAYMESKGKVEIEITTTVKIDEETQIENVIATHTYKRLMASSGNVRNRKVIFAKIEVWNKLNDILLCGMTNNMEFEVLAKFNSYFALASTDSIPVTMPNFIVIDDFEHEIKENFDLVKEIKKDEYKVIPNVLHKEKIKPFDGAGLVDISLATKWKEDMGLDYIPSSFQFRCIPGIKGNVYTFDIAEFAREYEKTTIKDAWTNEERQIFNPDGTLAINAILTKSQFKFLKQYHSFEHWLRSFTEKIHGYTRTFNISYVAPKYEDINHRVLLSYQPLQSLNLDTEQIEKLCKPTVKEIKKISTDVDSFLRFRGLVDDLEEEQHEVPEFYRALMKNKELFNDPYILKKVNHDIKKFKEKTYLGAVFVEGNYQTLIPDLVGLVEYAMDMTVVGCLKKNEVYSRYWIEKKVEKCGLIRFPHVAMEHALVDVTHVKNDYLQYIDEGIVTSCWDSVALRMNSADYDGDRIISHSSRILLEQSKSDMANTIIHIPYEEEEQSDTNEKEQVASKKIPRINEMEELIKTDIRGMKGDIGNVINLISILWSLPQTEQVQKYIKILSVVASQTIDYAKSGVAANIPQEITDYIKDIEAKKPYFLRYKYKSQKNKEEKINRNNSIIGEEPISKFSSSECTMNKLCWHMESKLRKIKNHKLKDEFDFTNLYLGKEPYVYNKSYPKVLDKLIELQAEYYAIVKGISQSDEYDFADDKEVNKDYTYTLFFDDSETELLNLCIELKMDQDKLLDYMVYAFYKDKNFGQEINGKFISFNQDKSILWNIFGQALNARLNDKEFEHKDLDEEEIKEKYKKRNEQIAKLKDNKKKVSIQLFKEKKKDKKDDKDNQDVTVVEITEGEIKGLKEIIKDKTSRKVGFTLLVLQKFCKKYNVDFKIYSGTKGKINKNHIIKLAGVNSNYYEGIMKDLISNNFIDLEQQKNLTVLECIIKAELSNSGKVYEMKDINDSRKYMKYII